MIYPQTHDQLRNESSSTAQPIILADVTTTSKPYSTEFFAPTISLSTFVDTDSAISELHNIPLGLSTSIFGSLDDALPLAKQIESGAVHVNGMTIHDEHNLPFGGIKDSGWGRFNGRGAVESFMWTKNIRIAEKHMLPLRAINPK